MSLIHDHQIPIQREHGIVLFKFAPYSCRASQVLYGCEIDKFLAAGNQIADVCTGAFGTKNIFVALIKNFPEIFIPTLVNNRAMRDDDSLRISGLFDYLQGRQCFSKTHFCVPKHTVTGLELFESFGDRVFLFGSEYYRNKSLTCRVYEIMLSLFHSFYSFLYGIQINVKPLFAG
ncbi:hypothetical protein SDC9_144192 [bioreactor metagenome]|uniref:Uncharacterized protein n=1 Tax=bioreactor metagenome TaxID=1076179 RepID=A0A645E635_9ZZZZ